MLVVLCVKVLYSPFSMTSPSRAQLEPSAFTSDSSTFGPKISTLPAKHRRAPSTLSREELSQPKQAREGREEKRKEGAHILWGRWGRRG